MHLANICSQPTLCKGLGVKKLTVSLFDSTLLDINVARPDFLYFFTPIFSSQLTFFWELLPPPSSGPSWTPFSQLCDSSHCVTPGPAHSGWEPTWAQQTIVPCLLTCFLTFGEDTWIKKAPSSSFADVFSNADKEGWFPFGDTHSKMEVLHCYWWSCFLP